MAQMIQMTHLGFSVWRETRVWHACVCAVTHEQCGCQQVELIRVTYSSETELRLIFLQYCDLPPLITVEDRQLGVSRSLGFQITKIVVIYEKNKKCL